MAVTRLLRIKECSGRSQAAHLKNNIFYICNPAKTENGLWIGGNAGQSPDVIYRNFMENKAHWGKTNGTQAFHYMLSLPPGCDVDEATMYKVTEEFCQELLGDNYYFSFTVHNDRPHMHSHITFDSVSKTDGYKFHSPKGDWAKRIQPITDRLCEKYNLPMLDYKEEDKRGMNYGEWKKAKTQKTETDYTIYDIMRDDIDEAIQVSGSYDEFLAYLGKEGYSARGKKFLSLCPPGRGQPIRTGRLGKGYSKDEILERIRNKTCDPDIAYRYKTYGNRQEMRNAICAKIARSPGWKMTPDQQRFWERWNNTYFLRKPQKLTAAQRKKCKKDILQVQKLSAALNYMIDYDIGDVVALENRKKALVAEGRAIAGKLETLRTKYYKTQPNYFLSRYEKLKADYETAPSEEKEQMLEELLEKIEAVCPYGEAVLKRQALKAQIAECRNVLKDNKNEQKVVKDIFEIFYGAEPEENRMAKQQAVSGFQTGLGNEIPGEGRISGAELKRHYNDKTKKGKTQRNHAAGQARTGQRQR